MFLKIMYLLFKLKLIQILKCLSIITNCKKIEDHQNYYLFIIVYLKSIIKFTFHYFTTTIKS